MKPLPRSTRLRLALATAAMILVTTYLASWVAMGRVGTMHYPVVIQTIGQMKSIQLRLSEHRKTHGEYPASLRNMVNGETTHDTIFQDVWGHPFCYAHTDGGFELYSLGRDGKPGGRGLDADIHADDATALERRLPLAQFVFQTTGSFAVLVVAVLASVCVGAVSYVSTTPRKTDLVTQQRLTRTIVIQVISAAVIAVFLAIFYVAASQSGH